MNQFKLTYVLLALGLVACQRRLEQAPITSKYSESFYKTEAELEEAVNAAYAGLQENGVYNTGIPAVGELPGEDTYDATPANDGGVYGQFDLYNAIAQNSLIGEVWSGSYVVIQRANIVLNRIKSVAYRNEETKKARTGEMMFIRALLYFDLVRIFGDVPLVLNEVSDPRTVFGQKRTSVNEVYAQIEQDLNAAILLLPDRTESNKTHVFKTAAQSLLGKVYLTLKEYPKAQAQLKAVEDSAKHDLLGSTSDVFSVSNELNKEIIFSVQFASGINANSEGSSAYFMFNPTGREVNKMTGTKGHGVIKKSFYDLYDASDKRKDVYVGLLVNSKNIDASEAYTNKIAVPTTKVEDADSDWVVLRYADVLLMLAEIENELGNSSGAANYVNKIRARAGIGNYAGATDKVSLFNEIDMQRRKELIWEGHRWFDLLRQGRAKNVLGITDEARLLMPIPASQIATDSQIKQNTGY